VFLVGGLSLLGFWIIQKRVSPVARNYLASFPALFFVWGVLQQLGGYSTFLFVVLPPNQHPFVALFWLLAFTSLWGTTIWIVRGNGANELLKLSLGSARENPKVLQILKLFFVVASLLVPLLVIVGYASGFFAKAVIELQIH
jgi:hypothetical protein